MARLGVSAKGEHPTVVTAVGKQEGVGVEGHEVLDHIQDLRTVGPIVIAGDVTRGPLRGGQPWCGLSRDQRTPKGPPDRWDGGCPWSCLASRSRIFLN